MKTLIIYSSKTGNTKKVAVGIYEALKEKYDMTLLNMKDVHDFSISDDYDIILIGYWIDRGTANAEAKKFIKSLKHKNIGFFATIGANPTSKHGQNVIKNMLKLSSSNNLIEYGLYNGLVDSALLEKLKTNPPLLLPKPILKKMIEAGENSREPNDDDINDAICRFDMALDVFMKS